MNISFLPRISLFAGLVLTACSSGTPAEQRAPTTAAQNFTLIAPDNPQIRYTGRVAVNDEAALYDWANVQIEFRVRAPRLELLFDDGKNDYNLFIDGVLRRTISTSSEVKTYPVELSRAPHHVKITKRTGPNFGSGTFLGIQLPEGSELLDLPPRPPRKIEFIGDSYTVGYGNEGPGVDCGGVYRPYENSYLTFATIAARALNAESHLTAISGYGAVRNYGDPNPTSDTPMPFYYARTLMERDDLPWDFASWRPDAVVVKLGANDHSTQPEPPADVFIAGLQGLLEQVHSAYGDVPVFLVADTFRKQLAERVERTTALERDKGNNQAYYVVLKHPSRDQLGCDSHPSVAAQEIMAVELVDAIKPVLNW